MSLNRNFKGVWIPKELWLNKDLTVMEKLFLVEIDSLDNEDHCFASNDHFAEFFELTKTRVSMIISSLCKKGFIEREIIYKEGTKQIESRVLKKTYIGYLSFLKQPIKENLKVNNTVNNTVKASTKDSTSTKTKKSVFKPPSIEEVKLYCKEKSLSVEAERFVDHYESVNWFRGKTKIKDWKATLRNWNRNQKKWNTSNQQEPDKKLKML